MANYPEVVFVDGPTGIGKGYFIEKLVQGLRKDRGLSVKALRAADFVLKESQEDERKYITYNTVVNNHESIYQGHIFLLEYISDLLQDNTDHTDVVVVDRSFITFLNYNLHQAQYHDKREEYTINYARRLRGIFKSTPTLYIGLTLGKDVSSEQTLNTLLCRIRSRGDNKPIDTEWLAKLIAMYKERGRLLENVVTHLVELTSNNSQQVIEQYFTENELAI